MVRRFSIGVGLPRWRDAVTRAYEALLAASRRHNCDLQYLGYFDVAQLPARVAAAKVDGLILYAPQDVGQQIKQQIAERIPVVSLVRELERIGWPMVVPDWAGAVKLAMQHLRRTGYRRLAYVGLQNWRTSEFCQEHFLKQAGGDAATWQTSARFNPAEREAREQDVATGLAQWLAAIPKPVGIVTYEENLAAGVIHACAQVGLSVPDQVGVISLCDGLPCTWSTPSISSVELPAGEIGERAIVAMTQLIQGQPVASQWVPVTTINPRASTGMADDQALLVADALRFIQDNACAGVAVEDVIRHLQVISRTKLYELFEQHVGRSPAAELRRVRIERACRLLGSTRQSVAEVARQSGFPASRHFSTVFRRQIGMTPSEYRKIRCRADDADLDAMLDAVE